jgi:multiple sugar transport system substrate-binding protein
MGNRTLFSSVVLVLFGAVTVFAGGQKEAQAASAPVKEGKMIAEVGTYAAHTDVSGDVVFSNGWTGTRIPIMDKQITAFNKHYPNVMIKSEVVTPADLEKVNLTAMAAGKPADVMMIRSDAIPFFSDNGAIIPLDDYIKRDKVDVDTIFYAGELGAAKYSGKIWALPNVVGGSRHYVYYNLDLVEKAGLDSKNLPKTWQEMDQWADAVRKNLPGSYLLEPNHTSGSHPPILVWMTVNNGKYISDDMKKILLDSPEALETLEWLVQFVKRQAGSYEKMAMTDAPRMDCIQTPGQWLPGTYVAVNHGAAWVDQLQKSAPNMRWAATLLPKNGKNPKAEYGAPTYAGWTYMIPKGAKNSEAGWEWLKFATAGEGQRQFIVKSQLRASPAKIFNNDPEVAAKNPIWKLILDDLDLAKPIAVTSVHTDIREVMYVMAENALYEKMTPKQAIEWGTKEAQKILDEWNAKRKK